MLPNELYNNNEKIRLDSFLSSRTTEISRTRIQKLIKNGSILVDEFLVKPSFMLKGDECITVKNIHQINKKNKIIKQNIPIDVIYEDKEILIINKQSGLVVHPGAGNPDGTLLNGLLYHFSNLSFIDNSRPGLIHRLDKETSGVMVIAKTNKAHYIIAEQFAQRKIKKVYRAITWRKINQKGEIKGLISRDKKNRIKFVIDENDGRYSYTSYKRLESTNLFSYLELYPTTGRTHQLRVHLQYLGFPIIKDDLYGGGLKYKTNFHSKYYAKINKVIKLIDRFALHAYSIEFVHPSTKKRMIFKSELPDDMESVLSHL